MTNAPANALPIGHRLHEFRIDAVIGEGGFSIVYLARDLQLERDIAIKEYLPAALAGRGDGWTVLPRNDRHRETFDLGLRSFVNEARLLASFDHPALVKVHRFWEENGTAYMVMPHYAGPTLKAHLQLLGTPPDEAWLKALCAPLLDALHLIHGDHCYHRDIAPDNILLLGPNHSPLLLDFGAARRVISDSDQALTVILKPGYAPIEQYAEGGAMKQGAWTDVYALCAVLYSVIAGRPPPPSIGRTLHDEMMPLSASAGGRYSAAFLAAIEAGLAVRPESRPQTVTALRERLLGPNPFRRAPAGDDDVTLLQPPKSVSQPPRDAPSRRRGVLPWIGAAAVVLIVAATAGWRMTRGPAGPATVDARAGNPSAAAIGATTLVPQAPSPAPTQSGPDAGRPLFGNVAVLDDLVRSADPRVAVELQVDRPDLVIDRDQMRFKVTSGEVGFLYVFHVGTAGDRISLLFPNALDKDNRIAPNRPIVLPRAKWQITAAGPPGTNTLVAMVTRRARTFAAMTHATPISEFNEAPLREDWQRGRNSLIGAASCAGAADCDEGFGAAIARVREISGR